jgi:putative ABC transport system substrate-binding protein
MFKRNSFCLLAILIFTTAFFAQAQQPAGKVPKIGFLDSGSATDPGNTAYRDAFLQGLRELGYTAGKNINVEFRYHEGKAST